MRPHLALQVSRPSPFPSLTLPPPSHLLNQFLLPPGLPSHSPQVVDYILNESLGRLPLFGLLNQDFKLDLFPKLKPISFAPGEVSSIACPQLVHMPPTPLACGSPASCCLPRTLPLALPLTPSLHPPLLNATHLLHTHLRSSIARARRRAPSTFSSPARLTSTAALTCPGPSPPPPGSRRTRSMISWIGRATSVRRLASRQMERCVCSPLQLLLLFLFLSSSSLLLLFLFLSSSSPPLLLSSSPTLLLLSSSSDLFLPSAAPPLLASFLSLPLPADPPSPSPPGAAHKRRQACHCPPHGARGHLWPGRAPRAPARGHPRGPHQLRGAAHCTGGRPTPL